MNRISKDLYYIEIAKKVLLRSTCMRRKHGSVIVHDDNIVATGFNGSPRGCDDCLQIGTCLRDEKGIPSGSNYELCRSVHAEMNAIIHAGREKTLDATLYMACYDVKEKDFKFHCPCLICTKIIINAGIEKVILNAGLEESGLVVYYPQDNKQYLEREIKEWRRI